ncbi:hypothetical protein PTTG_26695 [Puccinia triticina 1-1 BBBD Race 1]|uniref:Uncharacterized protein n=1 Tax=Puccinia triticina (isolate 1-1 / race 1 (BBBD)) TaxID=630390 RepID=A0A180GS81_PUCT1|nr:hypothetical protein PTTG_26695 [Puccinia triticina 1-1 BBBD Race 1]
MPIRKDQQESPATKGPRMHIDSAHLNFNDTTFSRPDHVYSRKRDSRTQDERIDQIQRHIFRPHRHPDVGPKTVILRFQRRHIFDGFKSSRPSDSQWSGDKTPTRAGQSAVQGVD